MLSPVLRYHRQRQPRSASDQPSRRSARSAAAWHLAESARIFGVWGCTGRAERCGRCVSRAACLWLPCCLRVIPVSMSGSGRAIANDEVTSDECHGRDGNTQPDRSNNRSNQLQHRWAGASECARLPYPRGASQRTRRLSQASATVQHLD